MNNGFTYGKDGDGLIKMPAKGTDNVTWAIVLPQGELAAGAAGSAYTADNECTGIRPAIHEIERNKFYENAIELVLNAAPVGPEGALIGKFSVSDTKQVYFSKGNLQYCAKGGESDDASATAASDESVGGTWRFAEHQCDIIGNGAGNAAPSATQTEWSDLFGWSTSGYNHGARRYQPWSGGDVESDYYAYGSFNYNLYDLTGQADWGYNAITNGGNAENSGWRTLTHEEWVHVFTGRADAALKYGHGRVNGVNGMVLLPDEWTLPEGLSFTPGNHGWGSANDYSSGQWGQMEANGAVFLPAAGYRDDGELTEVGNYCAYWSSSHYDATHV